MTADGDLDTIEEFREELAHVRRLYHEGYRKAYQEGYAEAYHTGYLAGLAFAKEPS
jgi:flagellar biosynthesis/type III secretory pathway protein FliH